MNQYQQHTLRWGIVATGNVAEVFCDDLINTEGNQITAVTSRCLTKAKIFADKYRAQSAYNRFEHMLSDDEVDVVYIATPHVYHFQQTLAALSAGKHVVCEKPLAMSLEQVTQCVELANKHGRFLMEAVWMNFFPTIKQAKTWLSEGKIGKPMSFEANFDLLADYKPSSRLLNIELGGGALMDIGLYPIFLATHILGKASLDSCNSIIGDTGVDLYTHVSLKHASDCLSHSKCSFLQDQPCNATVYGEKGFIQLADRFFCGQTVVLKPYDDEAMTKTFTRSSYGYEFEILAAHRAIISGAIETPEYPHREMISNHVLLAAIRHQIGLSYQD